MLKRLRFSSFREQKESIGAKVSHYQCRSKQYLSELCHIELASCTNKSQLRYINECNLPSVKYLFGFDFTAIEGVSKDKIYAFADSQDLLIQGANI